MPRAWEAGQRLPHAASAAVPGAPQDALKGPRPGGVQVEGTFQPGVERPTGEGGPQAVSELGAGRSSGRKRGRAVSKDVKRGPGGGNAFPTRSHRLEAAPVRAWPRERNLGSRSPSLSRGGAWAPPRAAPQPDPHTEQHPHSGTPPHTGGSVTVLWGQPWSTAVNCYFPTLGGGPVVRLSVFRLYDFFFFLTEKQIVKGRLAVSWWPTAGPCDDQA